MVSRHYGTDFAIFFDAKLVPVFKQIMIFLAGLKRMPGSVIEGIGFHHRLDN